MQQAIVVGVTRVMLQNPRALRWLGYVLGVVGAVGLPFAVHAWRSYPSAPEPMSLAEAVARADSDGLNRWVRVHVAPASVRCTLAVRDGDHQLVPIDGAPLVLVALHARADCAAIDAGNLVGVIRRPPPRWVARVVGDTAEPVYELTTWAGPGDVIYAVYLAAAAIVMGIALIVLGPIMVRRNEKTVTLAA